MLTTPFSSPPAPTPAPSTGEPDGPPAGLRLLGEARTALEPMKLLYRAPRLAFAPRGDALVVTLPGWRTDQRTMRPLDAFLCRLGHRVHDWGVGTNSGAVERDLDTFLSTTLLPLAASTDDRVHLVGWSLGGVIAREAARRHPDLVAQVVHFGTPVVGGPAHTAGARTYGRDESAQIARRLHDAAEQDPIRVPVTSIYTRGDGIVDWRASIDRHTPDVRHVAVRTTHLGLGLNPEVWLTVADALARPRG